MAQLAALLSDESGASLSEYAMVAAAFAVIMIVVMKGMQTQAGTQLTTTQGNLSNFGLNPP